MGGIRIDKCAVRCPIFQNAQSTGAIHCIWFMHGWIAFLEVISKPPQTIQGLAKSCLSIKR